MQIMKKLSDREKKAFDHRPPMIVCLGDSVTHGCFELVDKVDGGYETTYRPHKGYAARLQRKLNQLLPAAAPCVLDAGVSGDNAGGGLKRLERDVLSVHPDLVIVNFGLNDSGNPDVEKGVAAYTEHMRSIFQKIQASGAEALLLTPNRMCAYAHPRIWRDDLKRVAEECAKRQNEGILDRYVDAARGVAREMNIPIADAYAQWQAMERAGIDTTALLANDINHPTEEMHDLFVEKIMECLLAD